MKVSQLRVCNRPNFTDDKDEEKQKKSLRNQFFYQERTSQTFNLPIRERGMKTDQPKTST